MGSAETTVHGQFARHAQLTPGAPAIRCGARDIHYAELDARSNGVAARLAAEGVARGDRVGVLVDRPAELVVALLGVLKTGAAYVVLDPVDPPPRRAAIVADAGLAVVVTVERHRHLVEVPAVVAHDDVAEFDAVPGHPDDVACVAYTSGPTGRPKGSVVPHRAAAFDVSTSEIWGPLLNGAVLAVPGPRGRPHLEVPYRPPGTDVETWLAELWQELLNIERVGVDDDFFGLGGHSLTATLITREISARYDVFVRARTFYENATVARLAAAVVGLKHDVVAVPPGTGERHE